MTPTPSFRVRPGWWLPLLAAWLLGPALTESRAGLIEYVNKADLSFAWKLKSKVENDQGTLWDLHLVSQTWQGITWEHALQVYVPKNVTPGKTLFLWNQGGRPGLGSIAFGMDLASRMGVPCAILYAIPNQPLLGGKSEDGLIAETFVRHLKTRDDSWPLLFPMVKSMVRAMDALQGLAKAEWKEPVKDFIVSGGSKRGWTTWLTGAADPRVRAIAPLVIDTLNMQKQMAHQMKSFGAYSLMIRDYTERGLVPLPDTDEARRLWAMVDPYLYRDKLTMPKMIINGGNDPYWTVDALNLYWDDLKGDKWVLIVPNAGHDLQQRLDGDKRNRERALNGLAAFVRHTVKDNPMPRLEWKHEDAGDKLRLEVQSNPAPKAARLWVAHSPTRDFRKMTWKEQALKVDGAKVQGDVDLPEKGFVAFYGELEFETDGIRHVLSTQVRVAGEQKERR